MRKLTRSHLRLSSLGNATYSWMSGKFTDFQISILCHHIVSTKFSFEFHEFRIKNHLNMCIPCWETIQQRCKPKKQHISECQSYLQMAVIHSHFGSPLPVRLPLESPHGVALTTTSIDVECLFSQGCLLLFHVCNQLSAHTTCALLCLGSWSLAGMVMDDDILKVAMLNDVEGDEEFKKDRKSVV